MLIFLMKYPDRYRLRQCFVSCRCHQGIEAQSIAHTNLAKELGLKIIPIINKIDLPSADIPSVTQDLVDF